MWQVKHLSKVKAETIKWYLCSGNHVKFFKGDRKRILEGEIKLLFIEHYHILDGKIIVIIIATTVTTVTDKTSKWMQVKVSDARLCAKHPWIHCLISYHEIVINPNIIPILQMRPETQIHSFARLYWGYEACVQSPAVCPRSLFPLPLSSDNPGIWHHLLMQVLISLFRGSLGDFSRITHIFYSKEVNPALFKYVLSAILLYISPF